MNWRAQAYTTGLDGKHWSIAVAGDGEGHLELTVVLGFRGRWYIPFVLWTIL